MHVLELPFVAAELTGVNAVEEMKKRLKHSFITQVGNAYYALGLPEITAAMLNKKDGPDVPLSNLIKSIPAQKLPQLEIPDTALPIDSTPMTGAQEDAIMRSLNKKNAVVGLATLKKSMATIVTRHEVYAGRFEFRAKVWQCTKYPKHIYTLDDVPHDKICPRDREPLRQISW